MIKINDVELNFDITSPSDMLRLNDAKQAADNKSATIPNPPTDADDPEYLVKYAAWLNKNLQIYGNFLDEVFGDGVGEALLTKNPSFTQVFEINSALEEVLGEHVKVINGQFNKYKPNRATRRGQ